MSAAPALAATTARLLASFDQISLEEITEVADLQTRCDRKYLVVPSLVDALLGELPSVGNPRVLTIDGHRRFRYRSVYFDTPELHSYLGAARRRPRRFKVRSRRYLDTGGGHYEAKVRDSRGRTVKHRLAHDPDRDGPLHDRSLPLAARRFLAGIDQTAAVVDWLAPTLVTSYRRSTISFDELDVRTTIDSELRWELPNGVGTSLPGRVLVETKSTGAPSPVDRLLWRHGARPVTISKYCTGLAALVPDLPANKWYRILQRFEPYPGGRSFER